MSVWAGLIVARVLQHADFILPSGADLDAFLTSHKGPRLDLAEVVSQAAGARSIRLPMSDSALRARVKGRATPVDLTVRGLIVGLADGRLGLTAGSGRVVESMGPGLAVVIAPAAGRYVEAFTLPGVSMLGVMP